MSSVGQRRPPRQSVFILPVGLLARIVVAVLVALALIAVAVSGVLGRLADGTVVADSATVAVHQAAAERDLETGYAAETDQVKKARGLHLAISDQQADAIANKALTDLATLRHSALVAMGQALGATADSAEVYAKTTEQSMDARKGQPQPSVAPVLLAPRLYAIVSRFNQLATQLADQATADLTQSPPVSPTPTPRPTPTPTPTR